MGGYPKPWCGGKGRRTKARGGQENSNTLVLRYGAALSGKPYTCYAKHPLLAAAKTCRITLVSVSKPNLLMSDASPKEGSTIRMHCNVEKGTEPIHYVWQHQPHNGSFVTFGEGSSGFINVTNVVRNQTGWYRCVAGNAVNSESSEQLWLNVTFGPDAPRIDVAPSSVVQRGYAALENETVSLMCLAQSNPASQYVWFHNDSEVYTGPQLTITKILRAHAGDYTCVGQNSYLNTRSRKTITMTVHYPPDGSPVCSVEPALNHTSLRLLCSWPGGFPSPSLHWTGDLIPAGQQQLNKEPQTSPSSSNILLPSGGLTPNSSLFTCHGSHPALKQQTECSTRTKTPSAEPVCFSNVTNDKQFLILSCSWEGGVPKALLWWKGPGGQGKDGEESANVLIVRHSTFQYGKPYMCYAKHPLLVQTKTCGLTLVPVSKPSLLIRDPSPVEGSTVEMRCNVENGTGPIRYVWQQEIQRGNITIFAQGSNSSIITLTNVNRSYSGRYRCVGSNFINTESSDWVFLDIIFGPDVPEIDVTPHSITDRGFSALETESVLLSCQAPSNPASQYIWYYNNSQVYTGPQYTIAKVFRAHTGDYTCLAQNTRLNTRSKKTVNLIVFYPPPGLPSCSLEPAQNHTSLRLLCSWSGGFPSPSLRWTGEAIKAGQEQEETGQQWSVQSSAPLLLPSEGLIPNNSLFTCVGEHPARKQLAECSTRTYIPPAEPLCFAYVTNNQQYLMLSCSWDGGAPKALVWWEGPGGQSKGGQENSNILVLRYGAARSGKPYTCYAKHPLLMEAKSCTLTLEAPVLLTQRRVVSVYEGSDVQLTCNLRANYLPANDITWFNNQGVDVRETSKYMLLRTSAWANLTVRDAEETQDSGEYRCSTSNAVGGAEVNVTLVVKKHPAPPNATLIRAMYNSRHRNEVELEWQVEDVEENGGWTGFHLEQRWVSERPNRRGSSNEPQVQMEERAGPQDWSRMVIQDPSIRSYTVRGLIPTATYQFRVISINHRTIGHPSVAKTPVELRDNVYPAVVGAAVGGMLFAAIPTVLLLVYIIRNHKSSPRLRAMLFGRQHSQSRENINFPEDEAVAGSDGGLQNTTGSPSPGMAEPKVSSLPTASSPSHIGQDLPLQT
ncbi:V-set and immunoglobulin domain-containing protein 10-like 2 [Fundulus heteroclitus]|uniref:V-set and immunoglobulin domain-containing protein 10-like 2 n=1 Tax=Fundulus heteroclitus TaxID=8078 RepID=UPI00165CE255|nr:V-set and immunoglobulin domain-containing protein 10-like 2 [Fundulus heteroclitus]